MPGLYLAHIINIPILIGAKTSILQRTVFAATTTPSLDDNIPTYCDIHSHPAAVAYAAAYSFRTLYLPFRTVGGGEFGRSNSVSNMQPGEEVAMKLARRGNIDASARTSKV